MTVQTAIAIALVVGLGTAQYILMAQAMRDLARRPRVRGGNKVAWGLLILCVPIVGALVYGWMGPTSFVRRTHTPIEQRPAARRPMHYAGRTPSRRNVIPIESARQRRASAQTRSGSERTAPRRFPRTGS